MKPVVFLAAGLLAGCAVGPNYQPPKMVAPGNWAEPTMGKPFALTHWV